MPENLVPCNIGRAAALFNGALLGVASGAVRISYNGKFESYADCSDSGLSLWAADTGASLTVSLTLGNAGTALAVLAAGSELSLPEPGSDLTASPGVLLLAPPDGAFALRFPRAVATASWSYQWSADAPHEMTVEFRALPDASRLLMQTLEAVQSPVSASAARTWGALENALAAELSADIGWRGIGGWYTGSIAAPNGGRIELVAEAAGRGFYGRELTFELALRAADRDAVRLAAGALAAALPWHNRGVFYLVELVSCRAERAAADSYGANITLRALSPR